MLDLRNLLCASGWEVSGRSGDCSPADALFSVENEMVKWIISKKGLQVGLLFQLSGDLGKRTRDLRDVFYCDAVGHDVRLYFSKINTGVWKTESRAFVDAIDRIADEQDALY